MFLRNSHQKLDVVPLSLSNLDVIKNKYGGTINSFFQVAIVSLADYFSSGDWYNAFEMNPTIVFAKKYEYFSKTDPSREFVCNSFASLLRLLRALVVACCTRLLRPLVVACRTRLSYQLVVPACCHLSCCFTDHKFYTYHIEGGYLHGRHKRPYKDIPTSLKMEYAQIPDDPPAYNSDPICAKPPPHPFTTPTYKQKISQEKVFIPSPSKALAKRIHLKYVEFHQFQERRRKRSKSYIPKKYPSPARFECSIISIPFHDGNVKDIHSQTTNLLTAKCFNNCFASMWQPNMDLEELVRVCTVLSNNPEVVNEQSDSGRILHKNIYRWYRWAHDSPAEPGSMTEKLGDVTAACLGAREDVDIMRGPIPKPEGLNIRAGAPGSIGNLGLPNRSQNRRPSTDINVGGFPSISDLVLGNQIPKRRPSTQTRPSSASFAGSSSFGQRSIGHKRSRSDAEFPQLRGGKKKRKPSDFTDVNDMMLLPSSGQPANAPPLLAAPFSDPAPPPPPFGSVPHPFPMSLPPPPPPPPPPPTPTTSTRRPKGLAPDYMFKDPPPPSTTTRNTSPSPFRPSQALGTQNLTQVFGSHSTRRARSRSKSNSKSKKPPQEPKLLKKKAKRQPEPKQHNTRRRTRERQQAVQQASKKKSPRRRRKTKERGSSSEEPTTSTRREKNKPQPPPTKQPTKKKGTKNVKVEGIWKCSTTFLDDKQKPFIPKCPLDPRLQYTPEGVTYAEKEAVSSVWQKNWARTGVKHRCAFCNTPQANRKLVSQHERDPKKCKKMMKWKQPMRRHFFAYHRHCGALKLRFRWENEGHLSCPQGKPHVRRDHRAIGDAFLGKKWFKKVYRWKTKAKTKGRWVKYGETGWDTPNDIKTERKETSARRKAKGKGGKGTKGRKGRKRKVSSDEESSTEESGESDEGGSGTSSEDS